MSKKANRLPVIHTHTFTHTLCTSEPIEIRQKSMTTKAVYINGHFILGEKHHFFQAVIRDECPQLSIWAAVRGWGCVGERMREEQEKSISLALLEDCRIYLLYHKPPLYSLSFPLSVLFLLSFCFYFCTSSVFKKLCIIPFSHFPPDPPPFSTYF